MAANPTMSGNTITASQVAVGASETALTTAKARKVLCVKNIHGSQVLYLGPAGVTSATGYKLAAGESVDLSGFTGVLYGIASGASTTTCVLSVTE